MGELTLQRKPLYTNSTA